MHRLLACPVRAGLEPEGRVLRTLIADVTVLPEPEPSKVWIGIRWHTGATDVLIADRPLPPGPAKRSPPRQWR